MTKAKPVNPTIAAQAAARDTPSDAVLASFKDYLGSYLAANGTSPPFRLTWENGWVIGRSTLQGQNSMQVLRVRHSALNAMSERLRARAMGLRATLRTDP